MMCTLTDGCWKNQLFAAAIATVSSFLLITHCSLTAFVFAADYSYWLLFSYYSSLHLHHTFRLGLEFYTNIITSYLFHSNLDSTRIFHNWKQMNFKCHTRKKNSRKKLYKFIHKKLCWWTENNKMYTGTRTERARFEHIGWYHSLNDDDTSLSAVD